MAAAKGLLLTLAAVAVVSALPQDRLGGYYNDEDVGREGRYNTRGFLAGYPGSYDRYSNYARGGDLCPYENEERRVRRKRRGAAKNETRTTNEDNQEGKLTEVFKLEEDESVLLARVKRQP